MSESEDESDDELEKKSLKDNNLIPESKPENEIKIYERKAADSALNENLAFLETR